MGLISRVSSRTYRAVRSESLKKMPLIVNTFMGLSSDDESNKETEALVNQKQKKSENAKFSSERIKSESTSKSSKTTTASNKFLNIIKSFLNSIAFKALIFLVIVYLLIPLIIL